jgi:hypothetical protein
MIFMIKKKGKHIIWLSQEHHFGMLLFKVEKFMDLE